MSQDPTLADVLLQPREVAFLLMFVSDARDKDGRTEGSALAEDALRDTHQTLVGEMKIEHAPAGAWTGKLVTGETCGAVAAGKPQPKDKNAQALFKVWQHHARGNGNIPGGLVGRLGDKVKRIHPLEHPRWLGQPAREEDGVAGAALRCRPRLGAGGGRGPAG